MLNLFQMIHSWQQLPKKWLRQERLLKLRKKHKRQQGKRMKTELESNKKILKKHRNKLKSTLKRRKDVQTKKLASSHLRT